MEFGIPCRIFLPDVVLYFLPDLGAPPFFLL